MGATPRVVMGCSEVETQMDTLTLNMTDSSRLCLRLIYTPGCLALITSVI